MRSRTKTAAVALAGAVALSSAAYGIGSQAGGGTAAAGDGAARDGGPSGGWERGPGVRFGGPPPGVERGLAIGFDGLADELGVDPAELRDALRDFHERQEGDRRDAFAAALAEALGKPVAEVEAALERVAPGERGRGPCQGPPPLRELAAALDVTPAELREALREVRPGARFEDRRDDLVRFLAERFGLSEYEVERALPELPRPRLGGPGGPPGWD